MTDDKPSHDAPVIFNSKTRPQSADDEIGGDGQVLAFRVDDIKVPVRSCFVEGAAFDLVIEADLVENAEFARNMF